MTKRPTRARLTDRAQLARLWSYLRPYRAKLALALGLLAASFAIELIGPVLIRSAIDGPLVATARGGDLDAELARLSWLAAGYLACILAGAALGLTFARTAARVGRSVVRDLRVALWSKLVRVDARWHDQNPSGRVVTRMTTDLENLDELVSSGGLHAVFDLMKLGGFVVVLAFVQPEVFVLGLIAVPFAAVISLVFRRAARAAYGDVRTRVADQAAFTAEFALGIRTVRVYGREDLVDARYDALNRATRVAWQRTVRCFALFFASVDFVMRAAQAALLLVGGRAVALGSSTPGALVQAWLYFGKLQEPIRELGERWHVLQSALSSAERILAILDEPDGPSEPRDPVAPRGGGGVRFEGVEFAYESGRPVLRGADLAIAPGETVAIVGPTGAGKSTLLALLSRLHDPDRGRVLLDGVPVDRLSLRELRQRVAVVPQEPLLFDGSVLDNVRLFDESIDAATVERTIDAIGARAVFEARGGLAAEVGERGQLLSRGERQLVAFARALLARPEVLVLDEATASVDSATEGRLQAALAALRAGRTCLVVAHRLATVRDADRIVVIEQGRVVEVGRPAELVTAGGVYAGMHRAATALA